MRERKGRARDGERESREGKDKGEEEERNQRRVEGRAGEDAGVEGIVGGKQ